MPEQNLEFTLSSTTSYMSDHTSYASARHKRKTVNAIPPQYQFGDETKPKRFSLPAQNTFKHYVVGTSTKGYLTAMFQWSCFVNEQL